jgi:nucleoside-diphosphate-sugar epimerase
VSAAARYTVLGASGFIGRHLVEHLQRERAEVLAPPRDSPLVFSEDLGHVIYCIGLTADWRARPFDAIRAHVDRLVEIVERGRFASLLYLSSTRVYKRARVASEDALLSALPAEPDDLFDLSKMLGEAVCLRDARQTRVARISNVYGGDFSSDNFLSSVVRDALRGRVVLRTALASVKDYVGVGEVAALLPRIAVSGVERVYNVASGSNTSNGEILAEVAHLTGCEVEVADGAPATSFPVISVDRVHREFLFSPRSVVATLAGLIEDFRAHREVWEKS